VSSIAPYLSVPTQSAFDTLAPSKVPEKWKNVVLGCWLAHHWALTWHPKNLTLIWQHTVVVTAWPRSSTQFSNQIDAVVSSPTAVHGRDMFQICTLHEGVQ
jgi:hypothetical protein